MNVTFAKFGQGPRASGLPPCRAASQKAARGELAERARSFLSKPSEDGCRAGARPAAYRELEIQLRGSEAGWRLAVGIPAASEAAGSTPRDAAAAADAEGELSQRSRRTATPAQLSTSNGGHTRQGSGASSGSLAKGVRIGNVLAARWRRLTQSYDEVSRGRVCH